MLHLKVVDAISKSCKNRFYQKKDNKRFHNTGQRPFFMVEIHAQSML